MYGTAHLLGLSSHADNIDPNYKKIFIVFWITEGECRSGGIVQNGRRHHIGFIGMLDSSMLGYINGILMGIWARLE